MGSLKGQIGPLSHLKETHKYRLKERLEITNGERNSSYGVKEAKETYLQGNKKATCNKMEEFEFLYILVKGEGGKIKEVPSCNF